MNIDTLRRPDNTYRAAQYTDVVRCLNAPHVTHLQRDSMVVAIRPGSQLDPETREAVEGWTIDTAPNGTRGHSKFFPANEKFRAIRNILRLLNGTENNYVAGDIVHVEANQGEREGEVLATIGNEILIEYLMPGTTNNRVTSALVVYKVIGNRLYSHVRNYPHRKLAKKWIRAMHEQGTTMWEGLGQRETGRVPFPTL